MGYTFSTMERPSDWWVTLEEAGRAVHASLSLVEKWVREGKVETCQDAVSHTLLVSSDDVEDAAEAEAFRLLSHRVLAREDRD